jgi:ubiquinone/menaquinone biosynthesis C-methylase UbiE
MLRSPERVALMEVGTAVDLSLSGIEARSVLDVGTGSGLFAETFLARGLAAAGVDKNPAMLELARQYAPAAEFVKAEFDAMPFENDSFDLVFYGHVLHESEDLVGTLREARRVARLRIAALEWPYAEEQMGPPLEHRIDEAAVRSAAAAAGLANVTVHQLKHMVMFLIVV